MPLSIPADLAARVERVAEGRAEAAYLVWAAGLCLLHRRLDARRLVRFASPPRRGTAARITVHSVELSGRTTFRDLLSLLGESLPAELADDRADFEALVDRDAEDRSRHDLFDVVLADVALHRGVAVPGAGSLTVDLAERAVRADPGRGPWPAARWRTWAERWLLAVAAGLQHPDVPIAELHVLADDERGRVLDLFNATSVPVPVGRMDELLARSITEHADKVAVSDASSGEELSYAEVGRRADALAARLVRLGVTTEDLVGVWGSACARTLVAVLAVWRAGGAFVPLDPAAPPDRMRHASGGLVAVVATDRAGPALGQVPVLTVGPDDEPPVATATDSGGAPDHLAYVLYTSGSTGTPKGVEVSHRSLVNYLTWAAQRYGIGVGARVPVASSMSYDLTLTALLAPLLVGATVVVPPPGEPVSLRACVSAETPAAVVKVTPSHLAALADEVPAVAPHTGRLVVGGEALYSGHLRAWLSAAPGAVVENEYGPTEATVAALAYRAVADGSPVPIGRPIANVTAYVLDADLQPVPDDVVGEIYLGGVGVARGYRARPAETAARFVPHPLTNEPGARLYRTGDLAYRDVDGALVYCGRRDRQVKLGGVRVELGEVEAALVDIEGVQAAAVTLRPTGDGRPGLAAHIVCEASAPTLAAVRRSLRTRLPRAAIPGSILVVDQLPTTAGGKVDYAALAADGAEPAPGPGAAERPTGRAEELLTEIWANVLGVRPGRSDDFFSLGGDSILAIRVVAQAREHDLVIHPSQVFESGTVAGLAAAAVWADQTDAAPDAPGPVPFMPAQRWFLDRSVGHVDGYCQTRSFALSTALPAERVVAAVAALVSRHDALRLQVHERDGRWEQVLAAEVTVEPAAVVDLTAPEAELAWTRTSEATSAGVRASGPLVAYAVGTEPAGVTRLVLAVHHLAVDHVSWLFLVDDLDRTLRGSAPATPASSFVRWARRSAETTEASVQAAASTRPRNVRPHRRLVELDAETTGQLLDGARRGYNAEPLDILCTAAVGAYGQWAACDEVCVEVETSGREDPATAGAVGWFTRIAPVRLSAGSVSADSGRALSGVKDQLRARRASGATDVSVRAPVGVTHLGPVQREPADGAALVPLPQPTYLAADGNAVLVGLTVTGVELDGRLLVELAANVDPGELADLADLVEKQLHALRAHLSLVNGPGATPGDFRRVEIDDADLAAILAEIDLGTSP